MGTVSEPSLAKLSARSLPRIPLWAGADRAARCPVDREALLETDGGSCCSYLMYTYSGFPWVNIFSC